MALNKRTYNSKNVLYNVYKHNSYLTYINFIRDMARNKRTYHSKNILYTVYKCIIII